MARPGGGKPVAEKPKNFFQSLKRIISVLNKWNYIMALALALAITSAIFAIIAPNKLSDLADEIQKGLIPKTEKIELITEEISNSITKEELINNITKINSNETISKEDKQLFNETIKNIDTTNKEKSFLSIISLPESILEQLLKDITVEDTKITVKDQIEMFKLTSKMSKENTLGNIKLIDELPKSVYSIIEPKIDIDNVKTIIYFMATIYILSAIFSYIQAYSLTIVSNNFAKKLRTDINVKINTLPLKYFDSHETGDILSRVTNDVDMIGHNLNNSISSIVSNVTLFLGSIIMMLVTNWVMTITAILSTIIGFAFMFLLLSKSQKYFAESQKVLGELNGYIEEMYSGHNIVKVYNGTKETIEKFNDINVRLYKAKRNSIFLSGLMQPIMGFVGNFGYVAVCIVGALLVINGNITFGVIVAFMIYIRLFTNPLSQIAQSMTNLQTTVAASERVFEFLDEKEMPSEENVTKHLHRHKVKGEIEFKNVKFGYDKDKEIIKNFSAKALPGQKIAIVGPTGAGKTTLVNLLMKFYDIQGGEILIDGVSTKELTRENVHKLFVMVLQDSWLFNGTVRENIIFNQQNITDEEIWNVCKTVGIDHFIKTLPGGLDAVLEDNDSISSGQKQLLTIARGMVEDAPFLILDEATSNVDTRTEILVQKAMDKLTEGKTSFIIAHRLSTIKNADLILVMNNGNIVEQGNHEELLKKNGYYADLYNSQFTK